MTKVRFEIFMQSKILIHDERLQMNILYSCFFFLLCVYQRNSNIRISATVSKILFSLNNNNNKISPDDNKDIIRLSDLSLSSFRWAGFIPAKLMLPKTHAQCYTEIHLNCESFTFHISILWAL